MLISDSYRELNRSLHNNPEYGTSGAHDRHIAGVSRLIAEHQSTDILDYGCGKRALEKSLGFPIANYDPAICGCEAKPDPHDIVVCTDVLEHIEPECLEDVLADIRRCAKKAAYLVVCTVPATKFLTDGRNAHLIQEGLDWWDIRIQAAGFRIRDCLAFPIELGFTCD